MESHPGRYTIPKFDHAELVNYLGLVGPAEIAEKAGVSRTMVNKWRERFDDFPEPLVTLKMGPLWAWADVEPWIKAQRAKGPGRPQKAR